MSISYQFNYATPSTFVESADLTSLVFSTDLNRPEKVSFKGRLKNILLYRDAMLALRQVVVSDLRTPVKDRSAYLEWEAKFVEQLARERITSIAASREEILKQIELLEQERKDIEAWEKQNWKEYYKIERPFWKFIQNRDKDLWYVLDPVISVQPDIVSFEAFSKDESTYACLSVNRDEFEMEEEPTLGTTNIDFSKRLADEFLRIRTDNPLDLSIAPEGFTVETGERPAYLEKKIDLPESWVRGFLQVSSASALPGYDFNLSKVDVYVICSYLRRRRARWSPRSLRWELKPKYNIRVVFEPWEDVIELSAKYFGPEPQMIRTWGRRRLFLLEGLIPHAKRFRVHLIGKGLPAFYVAELPGMNFTLGLSGWVAKDWSGGAVFNTLSGFVGDTVVKEVVQKFKEHRQYPQDQLPSEFKIDQKDINSTIGYLYRHGKAYYDITSAMIRYRELSQVPFPEHLTEPSQLEKDARNYMSELKNFRIKHNPDKSIDATAKMKLKDKIKDISLTISGDGQVKKADCQCRTFQRKKLTGGPCVHLLALQFKSLELD